jgi:hypothetical protein
MTTELKGSKRVFRFGDFIVAAYRAWDRRRARGRVWLAVNARLVEFQGPQRVVTSEE